MQKSSLPHAAPSRCELCGMVAEHLLVDEFGVTHAYCVHHLPPGLTETLGKPDHRAMPEHTGHIAAHSHTTPHHQSSVTNHQSAHDRHSGHSVNMFRDRFWLSLALTIPVLLYSPMLQEILRFTVPAFPGSAWIPLVLGTVIFLYGGTVFLKSAWGELTAKLPGMMTLISLAITAAYGYSVATTFFIPGTEFFWELATLITIMLLGHWIEMRSVSAASGALQELAKLLPDTAERLSDGQPTTVQVSELRVGDLILVRPGGQVPTDGEVVEGVSAVNESMLTGESKPVEKTAGSTVIGGTVNGQGALTIKVTSVGESTALAGIMRLVAEAQASKSRLQLLADKAAFILTIVAIVAGGTAFIAWILAGADTAFAVERLVTVLVIACPHALGLAVPLVTAISTSLSAKNGLLIRERMALETARNVDVVLFDKTGTLTSGHFGVTDVWTADGHTQDEVIALAAAVESQSEHALAGAIVERAKASKLNLQPATGIHALAGQGIEGVVGKNTVTVGGPQLLSQRKITVPTALSSVVISSQRDGKTVVTVLCDNVAVGAIAMADLIRDESKQAVATLQTLGVRVAMVTGDAKDVAEAVGRQLGIHEVFAEVLPEHKVDKVQELQHDGSRVMMVGDGVNDAPALTAADVGVAIGAGTDVAIESAGIILVKNDPRDIVKLITLSRATYQKMIENLFWATSYNVIAIPLAAGALVSFGVILSPAVGAILMSLSTVIVAANAQLLRRLNLTSKEVA